MTIQAAASIDIHGTRLRYAEVQQPPDGYRLLRLGSCDFDFDVTHELLRATAPAHLDVVAEALQDAFRGSVAQTLRVAFHPPDVHAFTTALPTDLPDPARQQRVNQETALLMGAETSEGLYISSEMLQAEALPDADALDWLRVLALPDAVQERFERVLAPLPHSEHRWMLSTEGAARVAQWASQQAAVQPGPSPSSTLPQQPSAAASAPFTLLVGWYGDFAEYALLHNSEWYFGHHAAIGSANDCAYFSAALLDHLDVPLGAVGRVSLYGKDVDPSAFAPLQAVFGVAPEVLDPLMAVGVDQQQVEGDFAPDVYVPCIGAAL